MIDPQPSVLSQGGNHGSSNTLPCSLSGLIVPSLSASKLWLLPRRFPHQGRDERNYWWSEICTKTCYFVSGDLLVSIKSPFQVKDLLKRPLIDDKKNIAQWEPSKIGIISGILFTNKECTPEEEEEEEGHRRYTVDTRTSSSNISTPSTFTKGSKTDEYVVARIWWKECPQVPPV